MAERGEAAEEAAAAEQAAQRDIVRTMDLALRIGELMLAAGAGAADASAQMNNVAHASGIRQLTADVTFTELTMTYQGPEDAPPVVLIRTVATRAADYAQLTAVDHLVRAYVSGRIDRDTAIERVKDITNAAPPRRPWLVTVAWGVMGAGVAMMLDSSVIVAAIAFAAAACVDVIGRFLDRRRAPVFYQRAAGGLFAALVAAAVTAGIDGIGPSRVITSSIFLLLAGVSFLGAVQDALTGFPLTSTARFMEAIIATAGVLGGVAVGLATAGSLGFRLGDIDPGAIVLAPWPWTVSGAAIAAAAFAYAMQSPLRSLLPAALIGALGTAVYVALFAVELGIAGASVAGAFVIGLVSFSVSGRVRVPPLLIVTAAIVPLLPGLSAYRALALFTQGSNSALFALANAAVAALALGAGVIGGEYLAQPLKREARRLETKLSGPRLVGPITVRHERRRVRQLRRRGQ